MVRHVERVPLGTTYPEVVEGCGRCWRRRSSMGSANWWWTRQGWGAPVVVLEKRELRIARDLPERETLVEDLVDVRRTGRRAGATADHRSSSSPFRCMRIRPDHKSSQRHGGSGRAA